MIFTSTVMICLGLTLRLRPSVLAGDPYSKPRLSVVDSPVVNSGEYVTLQCMSWQRYDGFILTKEGDPKFSKTLESQYIFTGHLQAMFSLGPMTPNNKGKFRCYGYYKRDPQKWSMASDPLEIHVSGVPEEQSSSLDPGFSAGDSVETDLRVTEMISFSEVKIAPQPQNHTVDNLIRIVLIGLIFVVFWILQLKTWYSQRRI